MPRLWMIDPKTLCRKHLVAEHHECHVFLGKLKLAHKMAGYISANLFSLEDLFWRHEALAAEMAERGYEHVTPFPTYRRTKELGAYLPVHSLINRTNARLELHRRCPACHEMWEDRQHRGCPTPPPEVIQEE